MSSYLSVLLLVTIAFVCFISSASGSDRSSNCKDEADCSYNGLCISSICKCEPQWKGPWCSQLNLLPTNRSFGYQHHTEDNERISSWGGSVLYSEKDDRWHMYLSEIAFQCGINVWISNSFITHAVSETEDPLSSYIRTEPQIIDIFSHEPNAVRGNNGEYVIYFAHAWPPPTFIYPRSDCENGMSLDCDSSIPWNGKPMPTKMIWSQNPNGPWSDMIYIPTQDILVDSVLSTYIYPNGSLIGVFRGNARFGLYTMHASNWKDNTTYRFFETVMDVPSKQATKLEDPFIWIDERNDNVLHCLWHSDAWDHPYGYHTFSVDSGVSWKGFDHKVHAYDAHTEFLNGEEFIFRRCERPHLIFDKDKQTPVALTNAVEVGGDSFDYTYTLLRPINQDLLNDVNNK